MIPVVDYETFLANVNENDLAMLTSFLVGVEVMGDPPTAPGLFLQAERLYAAGLISDVNRRYFDGPGGTWEGFLGKLAPQAVGYVGQLARERVILSRDPIPTP